MRLGIFAPQRGDDNHRAGRSLGPGTRPPRAPDALSPGTSGVGRHAGRSRNVWATRARKAGPSLGCGARDLRRPAFGVLAMQKGNEFQILSQKSLTIQSRDRPPRGKGHL